MNKQLYCGAAKECITPGPELLPRLYSLMNKRFCTVHDDIFLRVAAFSDGDQTALIVSFDLNQAPWPKENLELLAAETNVPVSNILYYSIHTHATPMTGPHPQHEMPPDEDSAAATAEYEALIRSKLITAAKNAIASMVPAKIGIGIGRSYINVNRNQVFHYETEGGKIFRYISHGVNPEGPVDRTLFILKAEKTDGEPIAFFVNYPVHNITMIMNDADGEGNFALSGDIGGLASQYMEERFGGVALWSSGAAGDINPVMMNQYDYPNPITGEWSKFNVSGDAAALAALQLMSTRHFNDIVNLVRKIECTEIESEIRGHIAYAEMPSSEGTDSYRIRMQAIRIGKTAIIGASGELYTRLGQTIKKSSPFEHTVVLNHNASHLCNAGYIFDDETLSQNNPDCPVKGFIPGHKPKSKSGAIKPALEKCTRELCEAIC